MGTNQFPADNPEEGLARDAPPGPYVCFTSAPSWENLAAAYSALVDQSIENGPVALPPEVVVEGDLVKTSIRMMHWINKRVRYVALELGSNSIVPHSPREILAQGYGDCKDKATVLTTFLRQAGYRAFVALVWNDADEDIRPDVPGMDIFNHALVYVDGPRPLWLDPTSDFSRDEVLPYWDQERWALPAEPGIAGPIQTTLYPAAANTAIEVSDYYLQDDGNCNVAETTTYGGAVDLYWRQSQALSKAEDTKKDLESYAERYYSRETVASYDYSDPYDFDTPFTLTLKVDDTPIATTYIEDATVDIKSDELFAWLPSDLIDEKAATRKQDFRMNFPFIAKWDHRIHLPTGFIPRSMPETIEKELGAVTYRSSAERSADGTIVFHMTLEAKKSRLTPTEFDDTRKAVIEYKKALGTIRILFDHEAEQLYAMGEYPEAFGKFRALVAEEPAKAIHEIRLSKALLKSGLGDESIIAAQGQSIWLLGMPKHGPIWRGRSSTMSSADALAKAMTSRER